MWSFLHTELLQFVPKFRFKASISDKCRFKHHTRWHMERCWCIWQAYNLRVLKCWTQSANTHERRWCSIFSWEKKKKGKKNVLTDTLVISNNLLFSSSNMKFYITFISTIIGVPWCRHSIFVLQFNKSVHDERTPKKLIRDYILSPMRITG